MLVWHKLKNVEDKTLVHAFMSHFNMSVGLDSRKKQVVRVLGGAGEHYQEIMGKQANTPERYSTNWWKYTEPETHKEVS